MASMSGSIDAYLIGRKLVGGILWRPVHELALCRHFAYDAPHTRGYLTGSRSHRAHRALHARGYLTGGGSHGAHDAAECAKEAAVPVPLHWRGRLAGGFLGGQGLLGAFTALVHDAAAPLDRLASRARPREEIVHRTAAGDAVSHRIGLALVPVACPADASIQAHPAALLDHVRRSCATDPAPP